MRGGSAFYAGGTNRGTIAVDSSQKELTDRAISLLHNPRGEECPWVFFKESRRAIAVSCLYRFNINFAHVHAHIKA